MRKEAYPFLSDGHTPFFSLDENGALVYYTNDSTTLLQPPLGTIVLIKDERKNHKDDKYNTHWYSGKVIGLKVGQSHRLVIKVHLLQEWNLNTDNTYTATTIQQPPSVKSVLFLPKFIDAINTPNSILTHANMVVKEEYLTGDTEEDLSPSLQALLNLSKKGFLLGMIGFGNKPYGWETSELMPFRWDTNNLDNKHLLLAGDHGVGKTVFFKNLIYQIKKQDTNNRIILTDSKGDLSQLLFRSSIKNVPQNNWEKQKELIRKKEELQKVGEIVGRVRLIVPRTSNTELEGDVSSLLSFAYKQKNVDLKMISLRFQDLDTPTDAAYLFQTNSAQVAILLEDLANGIKSNEEVVSLSRLQSAVSRLLARNTGREVTLPTNGITYNRSVLELGRKVLRSLEKYFDISNGLLEYDKPLMDYFDFSGTVVLYLNHLNRNERFLWKMQLLKWFGNKKYNANTYLFLDEVHKILPKERPSETDSERRALANVRGKFEKLAREEKRFGANLIVSTRHPQDLHPIVQEYCATKVVMKTSIKNAMHLGLPKHLAHVTSNLNHGQFWIQNAAIKTADWLRVHGTAPPMPHESMDKFWDKIRALENKY